MNRARSLLELDQVDACVRAAPAMLHDSRAHRILRALLAGAWTAVKLARELEAMPIVRQACRGETRAERVHSIAMTLGKLRRGELREPALALGVALQSFNVPASSWYEPPSKLPTVVTAGVIVRGGG